MKILVDDNTDIVVEINATFTYQGNVTRVEKSGNDYILTEYNDSNSTVYDIASPPSDLKPQGYYYTSESGFTKNNDWIGWTRLQKAKSRVKEEIKEYRKDYVKEPIYYGGDPYEVDLEAQQNLTAAVTLSSIELGFDVQSAVERWITEDENVRNFTPEEFMDFGFKVKQFVDETFTASIQNKAVVNSLNTLEEVENYDYTANHWPDRDLGPKTSSRFDNLNNSQLQNFVLGEDLSEGDPIEVYEENGITKARKIKNTVDYTNLKTSPQYSINTYDDTHVTILSDDLGVVAYEDGGQIKLRSITITADDITLNNEVSTNVWSIRNASSICKVREGVFALLLNRNNDAQIMIGEVNEDKTISLEDNVALPDAEWHGSLTQLAENKIFVAYRNNLNHGAGRVINVSNYSVSFGNESEFMSNDRPDKIKVESLSSSKVVVAYADESINDYGVTVVGEIDQSDNVNFGLLNIFSSDGYDDHYYNFDLCNLDQNRFVISYRKEEPGNSKFSGQSRVGTVSGNSIDFDDPQEFAPKNDGVNSLSIDFVGSDRFIVSYNSSPNGSKDKGIVKIGKVENDGSITYSGETVYYEGWSEIDYLCFRSNASVHLNVFEHDGSGANIMKTNFAGTDNRDEFIGFMKEGGSTGDIRKAYVVYQVAKGFTGLTPGTKYYLDADLSITTVSTGFPVGIAIATNRLAITKKGVDL